MPAGRIRAGSRNVAPPNGKMPRATSSWAKRASSAAIATCEASSSSIPSVLHVPCAATTIGFGRSGPSSWMVTASVVELMSGKVPERRSR